MHVGSGHARLEHDLKLLAAIQLALFT
jgi:hypothetical protein